MHIAKSEGKFPMFFVWFLRLTTPPEREAQFTPPKSTSRLENIHSYADFCSRLVLRSRAKNKNMQNLPGISISKLHEHSEGQIQWFFDSFWILSDVPCEKPNSPPRFLKKHVNLSLSCRLLVAPSARRFICCSCFVIKPTYF